MRKKIMLIVVLFAEIAALFMALAISESNAVSVSVSVPVPIDNPSVELTDPKDANKPLQWSNNSWGNNNSVFTYSVEGFDGGKSVKIDVTDYKDGDAKWYFDPVELAPGDYTFSNYYRADVDTRVVAAVHTLAGDIRYIDLPDAPSSEQWRGYSASFAFPDYGYKVSIYHLLSCDGYLITDNYSIEPYKHVGFDRGLVTITFDDGWEENVLTALPVMKEFGFRSNQFYATAYIEHSRKPDVREVMTLFMSEGHEIGSHSVNHPRLTELSGEQVAAELVDSKLFLEEYLGVGIQYFATPYGAYNTSVKTSISEHYAAHRTVDRGFNSKDNLDVSRLKCQSVLDNTTPAQIAEWVKKAKDERLWLILLYHRVTEDPKKYDTTPALFYEHMRVIKESGIPVVTMTEALAELTTPLARLML